LYFIEKKEKGVNNMETTKIKTAKYLGEKPTISINVKNNHNFFADGVLTNNSHAVAYSKNTIITLYLKTYYPLYFYASCLAHPSSKGKQDTINEMKRRGIKLQLPNVNISKAEKFEANKKNNSIYYSLSAIKGIGIEPAKIIEENQPYSSFGDFIEKMKPFKRKVNKAKINTLIRANAFRDFTKNQGLLLKAVENLYPLKNTSLFDYDNFIRAEQETIQDLSKFEKIQTLLDLLDIETNILKARYSEKELQKLEEDSETITNLENIIEKEKFYYVIYMKDIFEKVDKNGNLMAFISIVDWYGNQSRLTVFQSLYKEIKDNIKKNKPYLIEAKGNSYNNSLSLILESEPARL